MGPPKQKWTTEEEAALRGGVEKYGPGKWRSIQKDAKFGPFLTFRSNVDLKDKWRNMSASTHGSTRERKSYALTGGEEAAAVTPLASLSLDVDSGPLLLSGSGQKSSDQKSLVPRYDDMVVDAVLGLKDTNGSSNATIASYIEERHQVPSNFRRLLTSSLKVSAFSRKLIKVPENENASDSRLEGRPAVKSTRGIRRPEGLLDEIRWTPRFPKYPPKKLTGEEAARAAMKAVAEAEAAAAAAEQAFREAEIAEAEADAAQAAAEAAAAAAAIRSPKNCTLCTLIF